MVRIVKPRTVSRAALVSLLAITIAALFLPAMWHVSRREREDESPVFRTLTDVELKWKCEAGHTFRAAGQVGPRLCWTCDRDAYPVTQRVCPVHGSFQVVVQFADGEDGVPRMSKLRFFGQDWVTVEDGLVCPRCSRRLAYQPPDPLDRSRRHPDRRGGG